MSTLIGLSIPTEKIDKSKLVTKDGKTYLNITVSINDQKDKFGNDVSAWHTQSKEQRDAKEQRTFIGNGKVLYQKDAATNDAKKPYEAKSPINQTDDDLPF